MPHCLLCFVSLVHLLRKEKKKYHFKLYSRLRNSRLIKNMVSSALFLSLLHVIVFFYPFALSDVFESYFTQIVNSSHLRHLWRKEKQFVLFIPQQADVAVKPIIKMYLYSLFFFFFACKSKWGTKIWTRQMLPPKCPLTHLTTASLNHFHEKVGSWNGVYSPYSNTKHNLIRLLSCALTWAAWLLSIYSQSFIMTMKSNLSFFFT